MGPLVNPRLPLLHVLRILLEQAASVAWEADVAGGHVGRAKLQTLRLKIAFAVDALANVDGEDSGAVLVRKGGQYSASPET